MPHLSASFTTQPFWLEGLPPFRSAHAEAGRKLDVAVIGAGPGGLSAALTLAKAGRDVTIFEAKTIDAGAVARSAGGLSHLPRARVVDLTARYSAETARAVFAQARIARTYVEGLIAELGIDCSLKTISRYIAAHSPRAFGVQEKSLKTLREIWGDVELVPHCRQRELIGSDAFYGGVRLPSTAIMQPAKYLYGLANGAIAAGAKLLQNTPVVSVKRNGSKFALRTQNGESEADHVILATGADTPSTMPDFRGLGRRIVPMPAFGLVTEQIPPELINRILPGCESLVDTYNIIHWMALTPDGRRLLMTGRAGQSDGNLRNKANRIFGYFVERFPDLRGIKVTHCWSGTFSITGDWLPHLGTENGVHYALGCCGTGIPMLTFLGHKAAQKVLRTGEPTVFERELPSLPFYLNGTLLPLGVRLLAFRDRYFR